MSSAVAKKISLAVICALFLGICSCAPNESEIKEAKIHYEMGLLYFQERDLIRALQELVKAKDVNPRDKHIWNALGLAYKERKLMVQAEDAFNRAIGLDDNFSEAYNNIGVLYLEKKEYKAAADAFSKAVKNIFYTTPELAHNNMGYAYQMLGDMAQAEKNYREAVSLNPSFASAYINLSSIYMDQKRYSEAEKLLTKFITVFETHLEANYALGKLYILTGNRERARNYLTNVIKIDPRSGLAASARDYLESIK